MFDVFSLRNSPALNPDWLKSALAQTELNGAEISGVEILYRKVERDQLIVSYGIEFWQSNQLSIRQLYSGFVLPRPRLEQLHERIPEDAPAAPEIGPAAILLKDANLLLLASPNDPNMINLSSAELVDWLGAQTQEWKAIFERKSSFDPRDLRVDVLRHIPGKRKTVRLKAGLDANSIEKTEFSVILKQFGRAVKAGAYFEVLKQLEGCSRPETGIMRSRLKVRFPRGLALNEEYAAILMEDLPGRNLETVLDRSNVEQIACSLGKALAHFHQMEVFEVKEVSRAGELADIERAGEIVQGVMAGESGRVLRLQEQLTAWSVEDQSPRCLLHGSFRLNHVLLSEDGFSFLDLEGLRVGHPAYDLANLLSSLYYLEAQERVSAELRKAVLRAFAVAYEEDAPFVVSASSVAWFLAGLLISKQATKYVTHVHPDLEEKVEKMLGLAEVVVRCRARLERRPMLAELAEVLP